MIGPAYKFVTAREFAEAAKRRTAQSDSTAGLAVRMGFAAKVQAGATGRIKTFTLSTSDVDRAGDTINQAGWLTTAYLRNPVVLWSHNDRDLPIAKTVQISLDGGNLTAACEFVAAEVYPFADQVLRLIDGGFLSAVSVGFLPTKWAWVEDAQRFGVDYIEQELLEFSVVPIPCNANCLIHPAQQQPAEPGQQALLAVEEMALALGRKLVSAADYELLHQCRAVESQKKICAEHARLRARLELTEA